MTSVNWTTATKPTSYFYVPLIDKQVCFKTIIRHLKQKKKCLKTIPIFYFEKDIGSFKR